MIGKLTEEQIEQILKENVFGHLGCNDGYNTYVYPVNYVYDGNFILCHSTAGSKIEIMRQNKRVCLQVEEIINLAQWKSVLVQGTFQELVEERERYTVMKAFVDKDLHQKISATPSSHTTGNSMHQYLYGNTRPVFYRIVIDEKNGRFEDK